MPGSSWSSCGTVFQTGPEIRISVAAAALATWLSPAPAVFNSNHRPTLCKGCRATPGLSHMMSRSIGQALGKMTRWLVAGAVYSGEFFGGCTGREEPGVSAARLGLSSDGVLSACPAATGAQPCQAAWCGAGPGPRLVTCSRLETRERFPGFVCSEM